MSNISKTIDYKKEVDAILDDRTADFIGVWDEFLKNRKKLKKSPTDCAKYLLLKKLDKLASTEEKQMAIMFQSIENSWQGLFPLRSTDDEIPDF